MTTKANKAPKTSRKNRPACGEGNDVMPNPVAYPQCAYPGCNAAFVLRRMRSLTTGSYLWLWQRDCKHKNAACDMVDQRGQG